MNETVVKRRHGFVMGLGIFFLLMLCATAGVLYWLWGYLQTYEASTPTAAMQYYMGLLSTENYDEIYETSGFKSSEFAGKTEYISYLKNVYAGDLTKASLRKKTSHNKEEQVYEVQIDGRHAATVELVPAKPDSKYKWQARTRIHYLADVSITAPPHVQVLINGKTLGAEYIKEQDLVVAQFYGVQGEVETPKLVRYVVSGLLSPPEVTAQKQEGTPCTVAGEQVFFTVSSPVDADKQPERKALLEKVAKTYAAFITRDATAKDLHQYLYKDTDFYNAIKNFYNGWYIEHDSFDYRNVQVSELEEFSGNDFTGTILFDYVICKGRKEYVYPSSYQLTFMNFDGRWLVTSLVTK